MSVLKITEIGDGLGVVFPEEFLTNLKLRQGDELLLTQTADGFLLTVHESEFERQLKAGREIMKKRNGALRELAK